MDPRKLNRTTTKSESLSLTMVAWLVVAAIVVSSAAYSGAANLHAGTVPLNIGSASMTTGTASMITGTASMTSGNVSMTIGTASGQIQSGVVLNEILASNGSGIADEDGDLVPWIELYNAGDQTVNLRHYGLSDDDDRPWQWVFPEVNIEPGEFLLIFASGKDRTDPDQPLHTNFRVSQAGEEVLITDYQGNLIDRVPPTPMFTDVSYGRQPDGSEEWFFFDRPTPGAPNTTDGYQQLLSPPKFSHNGGFYTTDLELELSMPSDPGFSGTAGFIGKNYSAGSDASSGMENPRGTTGSASDDDSDGDGDPAGTDNLVGTAGFAGYIFSAGHDHPAGMNDIEIRYTLDGSVPDRNSRLYKDPIRITDRTPEPNNLSTIRTSPVEGVRRVGYEWKEPDGNVFKGTVIRARAFRQGSKPSPVATHTYFVDPQGSSRYHLPVVSIVTDSLNLFDYETGIYIPGIKYDEQNGDNHLHGNYAFRGIEWERPAAFELFDEQGERVHFQDIGIRIHGGAGRAQPMKSLRLYARNEYGDNRFYYPIFPDQPDRAYNRLILRNSGQDFFVRSTMFRDAFMQELVKDFNFDTQAYRPAIVFINGEYWGIQNFRERYDVHYLERTHGVDPGNIDLLTNNAEVKEGDAEHYLTMLDYIRDHDPAEQVHYEEIGRMMDLDNFLDYLVAQVFLRNIDWPGNNVDFWRVRTGGNGSSGGSLASGEVRASATNGGNVSSGGTSATREGSTPATTGSSTQATDVVSAAESNGEYAPAGRTSSSGDVNDGRWRWLMIDTDAGFGLMNPFRVESYDMIRHMTREGFDDWPNPDWSTFLIRRLLRNEEFRNEFINRSADYMNTVFRPSHIIPMIDRFEANLEPVIEEHIRRWRQIDSKEQWHFNVERMREFADFRPGFVYEHIMNHFDLEGTVRLETDVSSLHKGRIQINRITIDEETKGLPASKESPYPWKGTYFKGVPVRFVARPFEGYRLSHWEIKGVNTTKDLAGRAGQSTATGRSTAPEESIATQGASGRAGQSAAKDRTVSPGVSGRAGRSTTTDRSVTPGITDKEGQPAEPVESATAQSISGNATTSETLIIIPRSDFSVKAVFVPVEQDSARTPEAHALAGGDYHFDYWDPDAPPGSRPDNMVFQYMKDPDPGLRAPVAGVTNGAYNLSSRTRINGLGNNGISFINTSSLDGNPGYPGTRLGAAVLALDTRGMRDVTVSWTGGTVEPNSRVYHLRLQYRTDLQEDYRDVRDESGEPVEYRRNDEAGHFRRFEAVRLPSAVQNKPHVELRWKYYHTGEQIDEDSGARTELRLDDIHITGVPLDKRDGETVNEYAILSNYPNPFNDSTVLQFTLPEETRVSVTLFDASGRQVRQVRDSVRLPAGYHTIRVDASDLASGMYIYRVETPGWTGHGKMTLIR